MISKIMVRNMSVTILTIDGGGMKGIISAIVLMKLEKYLRQYSKNDEAVLTDYFDIVAGTSTGSILTALLLCPDEKGKQKYRAEDVLELYMSKGKDIFRKRPLYPINSFFGLCKSRYTNHYFKKELEEYFGELKISELLRPCMIVTYDMESRKTLFLNSISSKKNPMRDIRVSDAVLASCSAPTYFPPVCTKKDAHCKDCLVDGGVAANNPSMSALIEALKLPQAKTIQDTYLLSIGNVSTYKSYSCDEAKGWGIAEFALPLLTIIMETSEEIVDYQLRKLYECYHASNHYLRIEACTRADVPAMNDTSKEAIQTLVGIGNKLADREELSLRHFAKQLVERKQLYIMGKTC